MRWPRDNITESRIALQTSSLVRAPYATSSVCVIVPLSLCSDDESRVKLGEIPGEEGSDYINACWMDVGF